MTWTYPQQVYESISTRKSKTVGLAVAMGDAPDELKVVADFITLDVDHSGLAAAIDKFFAVRLHILAFCYAPRRNNWVPYLW